MLECSCITVSYGRLKAVDRIDLTIQAGELASVIGPNGAGKTTLLRAISGMHPIASGKISYGGRQIDGLTPSKIVQLGISHVPAGFQLFGGMTVEENLMLGAYLHTRSASGLTESLRVLQYVHELFPVLLQRRHQIAGTLSGGQQQMVAIGRALMARPKLLLLDEPSLGLAPLVVKDILQALRRLNRDQGLSILLVEQNARLALEFASKVVVLGGGQVMTLGTPAEVMKGKSIAASYLGG